MYDIITVGSSTIDVFAGVESEQIKIKTANREEELIAYPCGSKILINKLEFETGGGGTNTAAALSRLGLKVAYLGKIGSGSNGGLIRKMLLSEKVDFIGMKSKKYHTGYSIILDSIDGDRTILTHKGANDDLGFEEINLKKIKTKWFYFSSMIGKSYETLEKLADFALKNQIKVAFNPSNYLAEKGYLYLKELLSKTDLLILNREEATLLAKRGTMAELIRKLMSYGPERVIITDGKEGAFTIHNNRLMHVLTNKVTPVETTGAGDAFASTFLAGIIKKKSIETSMRMAYLNSEAVILERGAKTGLMKYRYLISRIKAKPPKIKLSKI